MGVTVEHAGQDRPATDIDLDVAIEACPERDDPAALDRDVAGGRVAAGPVEDTPTAQHRPGHRASSGSVPWSSVAAGPIATRARKRSGPPSAPDSR